MGSWDFQFHSGPLHSDERNAHSDAPAIGSISKQGGRALESLKFRIKLRSEILHVRAVKPGEPFRVFIDGKLFEVRRSAPPLQRELEVHFFPRLRALATILLMYTLCQRSGIFLPE